MVNLWLASAKVDGKNWFARLHQTRNSTSPTTDIVTEPNF